MKKRIIVLVDYLAVIASILLFVIPWMYNNDSNAGSGADPFLSIASIIVRVICISTVVSLIGPLFFDKSTRKTIIAINIGFAAIHLINVSFFIAGFLTSNISFSLVFAVLFILTNLYGLIRCVSRIVSDGMKTTDFAVLQLSPNHRELLCPILIHFLSMTTLFVVCLCCYIFLDKTVLVIWSSILFVFNAVVLAGLFIRKKPLENAGIIILVSSAFSLPIVYSLYCHFSEYSIWMLTLLIPVLSFGCFLPFLNSYIPNSKHSLELRDVISLAVLFVSVLQMLLPLFPSCVSPSRTVNSITYSTNRIVVPALSLLLLKSEALYGETPVVSSICILYFFLALYFSSMYLKTKKRSYLIHSACLEVLICPLLIVFAQRYLVAPIIEVLLFECLLHLIFAGALFGVFVKGKIKSVKPIHNKVKTTLFWVLIATITAIELLSVIFSLMPRFYVLLFLIALFFPVALFVASRSEERKYPSFIILSIMSLLPFGNCSYSLIEGHDRFAYLNMIPVILCFVVSLIVMVSETSENKDDVC